MLQEKHIEAPQVVKALFQRPQSLAEVARIAELEGGNFSNLLCDFLDHMNLSPSADALAEEPMWLEKTPNAERRNVWLGAAAEHLSIRHGFVMPKWAGQERRFLRRPWFVSGMKSLMAMELAESPAAFRRRMIFALEPLSRV